MRLAGAKLTIVFCLCFAVFGSAVLFAATPKYVFRLAHISDESHPSHKGALLFKRLVEERTDGLVRIDIFPNSQLGSAPEYAEQIKMGRLELGLLTSGQLQAWIKEYGVVMIPFLFDSYDFAHLVLDGAPGQFLARLAQNEGFQILGDWEWGFRQITTSKRPINSVEDIKGLKMRVPAEFQLMEMYKALGCVTTTISFAELYMALAQGVVDGQCNPLPTIYSQKFYEVQKYVAITNHVYNSQMLVMSKKIYDTLPQNIQQILRESAYIAGIYVRQLVKAQESTLIAELEAKGVKVTYPDLATFRKAVQPAIENISNIIGKDFTRAFVQCVEKYREIMKRDTGEEQEMIKLLESTRK